MNPPNAFLSSKRKIPERSKWLQNQNFFRQEPLHIGKKPHRKKKSLYMPFTMKECLMILKPLNKNWKTAFMLPFILLMLMALVAIGNAELSNASSHEFISAWDTSKVRSDEYNDLLRYSRISPTGNRTIQLPLTTRGSYNFNVLHVWFNILLANSMVSFHYLLLNFHNFGQFFIIFLIFCWFFTRFVPYMCKSIN